jgi:hypothetical protein
MRVGFPKTSFTRLARGLVAVFTLAATTGAIAQSYDCDRLREQIASATARPSGVGARYAAAAQKQQYEINRTGAYAASIGCNNRQFLMFGSPPPPQCAGLEQQMQRMRSNLSGLQEQARVSSGDGQKGALQARYDATCRNLPRGFFDTIFGGGDRQQVPIDDGSDRPPRQVDEDRPRGGGSEAVCVRTCDGGYFPISYSARRARIDTLAELCEAQCPGTETALYTMPYGGSIDQAVSSTGEDYSDLPNAGKFRKKFDAACACKPANKSWVEALAHAEELLGQQARSDVIVTPEKSDELSRPKNAVAKPGAATADLSASPGVIPKAAEPTGSMPGKAPASTSFGLKDGETSEKTDAAGGRRQIRVIGPKF